METTLTRRFVTSMLTVLLSLSSLIMLPTASSSAAADDLLPALVPSLAIAGYSGDNGFVVTVSNYDPAYTWTLSQSQGSISFRQPTTGSPFSISVRNVPFDSSSTVTVTATRTGYADGSSSIVGYSKKSPLTPTFSEVTPFPYGFSFRVTNYDPNFTWSSSASGINTSIDSSGLVTATNVYGSGQYVLTVTTTRVDYASTNASIYGAALPLSPALTPSISAWDKSTSTISAQIANFDSDFAWSIDSNNQGSATISDTGLIEIVNLWPGQAVPVTLTSARYGYVSGVYSRTVSSLYESFIPEFDYPVPTDDGFIAHVTNFDTNFSWQATSDVGEVFFDSDGTLVVTGLEPGQSATLTITNDNPDYVTGSATLTGLAAQVALTPTLGEPTRSISGFTVHILNFNPSFDWYVSTDSSIGDASIDSTGLVSVTGLNPGQSTMLIISTARSGYPDGQTELFSSALSEIPLVDPPVTTPDSSGDSSDVSDGDIDSASASRAESAERQAAEAQAAARIKAAAEAVIEAKVKAKELEAVKVAEVIAAKLERDLRAVAKVNIAPVKEVTKLVAVLTPAQIGLIPIDVFKRLSPILVKTLSAMQAAGLSISQVKSLSGQLLSKLSPAAIGFLKPEALGALSVSKLKALTARQVKEIWAAQIMQLDPDQKRALRR